jgi:phenylacetate-coenzyme A ligase PaaK-like adenylate-forming protein
MRELHLTPDDITGVGDLFRLPVTTKAEFLAEPEAFRLDAPDLPVEERTVWDVIYTTGTTTGVPAAVYSTTRDYMRYLTTAAATSELIDIRRGDVVANLFPLTPFPTGASLRLPAEAAACGASVVTALPGRPGTGGAPTRSVDDLVDLLSRHDVTVLIGVAGFVRRLLIRVAEMDVSLPSLRMCTLTGEASSDAFRADISRRMSAVTAAATHIVNRYGSTEQGTSMVECAPGAGFHDLSPDQVFLEVTDDTGASLPDGQLGQFTFTHLVRRGTVLLRYAVGDTVALDTSGCAACGRTSSRLITQPVRRGHLVKLRGTLVNLDAVQEALDRVDDLDEYQVVLHKPATDPLGMDVFTIRIAVGRGAGSDVAQHIQAALAALTGVTPIIDTVRRDEIFDPLTMAKPQRIVDSRPAL